MELTPGLRGVFSRGVRAGRGKPRPYKTWGRGGWRPRAGIGKKDLTHLEFALDLEVGCT